MLAEKITKYSYKVTEADIDSLRETGCCDEEIFEAIAVTALFNCLGRMSDALGASVEGFQDMVEQIKEFFIWWDKAAGDFKTWRYIICTLSTYICFRLLFNVGNGYESFKKKRTN